MMRPVMGVDPSLTGACAFLDASGGLVAVDDLYIIRDGRLGFIDFLAFLSRLLFPTAPLDRTKDHGGAETLTNAWHGIQPRGQSADPLCSNRGNVEMNQRSS